FDLVRARRDRETEAADAIEEPGVLLHHGLERILRAQVERQQGRRRPGLVLVAAGHRDVHDLPALGAAGLLVVLRRGYGAEVPAGAGPDVVPVAGLGLG